MTLQWNWSSPGMRSGGWRKPLTLYWLRASMSWLMGRITTSPCCCTLMRHLWSWNSWLRTPSSVFLIKRPSRESQHSPTPSKLPRGTVCLLHCTALHDPASAGCRLEEASKHKVWLGSNSICVCLKLSGVAGRSYMIITVPGILKSTYHHCLLGPFWRHIPAFDSRLTC